MDTPLYRLSVPQHSALPMKYICTEMSIVKQYSMMLTQSSSTLSFIDHKIGP